MGKTKKWFANLVVICVLLAQALSVGAQGKLSKSGGAVIGGAGVADAFVNVGAPSVGGTTVTARWEAGAPNDVQILGFDVQIEIGLSNGSTLRNNKSVGGNERTTSISFLLPAAPQNNSSKPAGGNNNGLGNNGNTGNNNAGGNNGNLNTTLCLSQCAKSNKEAAFEECAKKCQQGAAGNSNTGNKGLGVKETGVKEKVGTANNAANKESVPRGLIVVGDGNGNNAPAPQPVTIKTAAVQVTAKFSSNLSASAFREFAAPMDKVTGELIPKGARNRGNDSFSLQVNKLVHLSELPARAKECAAGQDCFELMAQARGGGSGATQFKIQLEAIYANGQRKSTTRAVNNVFRPVLLSVDKPVGTTLLTVLINVNAESAGDNFTKSDAEKVAIVAIPPIKK